MILSKTYVDIQLSWTSLFNIQEKVPGPKVLLWETTLMWKIFKALAADEIT